VQIACDIAPMRSNIKSILESIQAGQGAGRSHFNFLCGVCEVAPHDVVRAQGGGGGGHQRCGNVGSTGCRVSKREESPREVSKRECRRALGRRAGVPLLYLAERAPSTPSARRPALPSVAATAQIKDVAI